MIYKNGWGGGGGGDQLELIKIVGRGERIPKNI